MRARACLVEAVPLHSARALARPRVPDPEAGIPLAAAGHSAFAVRCEGAAGHRPVVPCEHLAAPMPTKRRSRPGRAVTACITCLHMHMHARARTRGTASEPRLHAGARRRVPHPCREVLAAGEHNIAARVPGKPFHSVARPLQAVDAPACGSVPHEDAPCAAPSIGHGQPLQGCCRRDAKELLTYRPGRRTPGAYPRR